MNRETETISSVGLLERFIAWQRHHVKNKHFVLVLSLFVGVGTALAAFVLKFMVDWIKHLLTYKFAEGETNWWYLVYPIVGIFITGLVIRYVVKDDIGHGVTKILYAISRRQSRIRRHNVWSSVLASSITIGFGGSVGAEAPIVLTGSAIGSNLGSLFRMDHKVLMQLVGCGAAGAVAGIFKAPIAGVVFVLEVLMIDLTMASLMPLLVSSVTAATVSYLLTGQEALFAFHLDADFALDRIPAVILLGIVCGLVSLYFTRTMNWIENVFHRQANPYAKFALGSVLLSVLIFLFPSLYGEGYDTIDLLLNGTSEEEWRHVMDHSLFYGGIQLLPWYLLLVVLSKVFASSATNGGGGCGGIFAPSLFLGCITGFVFAYVLNGVDLSPVIPNDMVQKNFALLGMAGLMSGVMHAPLTGIFLIAELTGGYDLFLPLMIVSVCAYLTIMVFEPHSIYSMRLAKRGELLTHHKDKSLLTLMNMESVIERDFHPLHIDMDLGDVANVVANSKRNVFPVLDGMDQLLGLVYLDDIRKLMFRMELYHLFKVEQFMQKPWAVIVMDDSMETVMEKFDNSNAWNLPVVGLGGKYVGMLSKSRVFYKYRQMMADLSEE